MESTLFSRLDQFIKYRGLNDNKVTVQAQIAVGTLGKQRRTGKGLSYDSLVKILRAFPELSPSWLILGEGEMINHNQQTACNINNLTETLKKQEQELNKQQNKIDLLISQLDYMRTQLAINIDLSKKIMEQLNNNK